jgi:histidine triad (HIT) family protein
MRSEMSSDCVFCKIATGEIPSEFVYQDEEFVAFRDIHPQAPVHVLLIPRKHYPTVTDMEDPAVIGRAIQAAGAVAKKLNIDNDGFRLVINCRDNGGQTVYHMHVHILGGRFMTWPPG